MGRAIVRDPTVFLFDEPLSNLDAKLRVQMRSEIKELQRQLNTTTVYVTHDQIEAMTMADRIVIMQSGRIEQIGKPLELYDRPANLFVASFIGSPTMNLFEGKVTQTKSSDAELRVGTTSLPLPKNSQVKPGEKIVYGVRPEHLRIGASGQKTQISLIEPTGSESLIHCRVAGRNVVSLVRERFDLEPGQEIMISPDSSRLHLFDPASGARIN